MQKQIFDIFLFKVISVLLNFYFIPILIEIQSLQDIVALVVISKATKEVTRYALRFSSFVTSIMNLKGEQKRPAGIYHGFRLQDLHIYGLQTYSTAVNLLRI